MQSGWIGISVAVTVLALGSCASKQTTDAATPEALSLLGKPLDSGSLRSRWPAEELSRQQLLLQQARQAHELNPNDEDAIIWHGRREAYLGHFRKAIQVFSEGLERFPDSYRLLRHRGHRYITTRQFDKAWADLTRASELIVGVDDQVEPDGQPNSRNIPTSTTHTNIWYHLGLAHYLRGEFDQAAKCYYQCLELSRNDDMRVAAAYWLYLSWMRSGQQARAERVLANMTSDLQLIENVVYLRLMLLFKGEMTIEEVRHFNENSIDDATTEYGLAMWHLFNGHEVMARQQFLDLLAGPTWSAFGYIAAEAEVARTQSSEAMVELVE